MRVCRFAENRLGVVDGDRILDVSEALDLLPDMRWPPPLGDALIGHFDAVRARIADLIACERSGASLASVDVSTARLLSPVARPSRVLAAPTNYQDHVVESRADAEIHNNKHWQLVNELLLFVKASASVVGPGEGITLRRLPGDRRQDHEAEIVAVIGRECSRVTADEALDHVLGYTLGLDITLRGVEDRTLRKSMDSYTVIGPWLVTADEVEDPEALDFELSVNGVERQRANTKDLILSIGELISRSSFYWSLRPGDVIFTGTPAGVGPIEQGDIIRMSSPQLGGMKVAVSMA